MLYFLANKPRRKLSGITKKRKTFCIQGTIRENAEPETSKTKHSRKSSHSFKVRSLVGKIQTKLLPRATLIQLSNVRLNYFEVYPEIALQHFQKTPNYNSGLYCLLWTSQLQPVLNLMWWSFSMQPIKFNVTALIPWGRGSNQSTTQFKFWTDFSDENEVACSCDQRSVSGALSSRKHGLFHIRYFEHGQLEPG